MVMRRNGSGRRSRQEKFEEAKARGIEGAEWLDTYGVAILLGETAESIRHEVREGWMPPGVGHRCRGGGGCHGEPQTLWQRRTRHQALGAAAPATSRRGAPWAWRREQGHARCGPSAPSSGTTRGPGAASSPWWKPRSAETPRALRTLPAPAESPFGDQRRGAGPEGTGGTR